jgi:Gluconate 2-dehydrogenase subunit 3
VQTLYPKYNVLAKWDSPSFDDKTRRVLAGRLHAIPERRFLTAHEWRLMEAISARLIPQPDRATAIPITPWIDEHLFAGRGEGFRHDGMPPLREVWRAGLAAIDGEARRRHGLGFTELDGPLRDETLAAVQQGRVEPALWGPVPAQRFFIDILLKSVAEIYYSHPAAWSEIGFGGPASPRGYVRLGFDERDSWEAKEER